MISLRKYQHSRNVAIKPFNLFKYFYVIFKFEETERSWNHTNISFQEEVRFEIGNS